MDANDGETFRSEWSDDVRVFQGYKHLGPPEQDRCVKMIPLKRVLDSSTDFYTGLKPGVNETGEGRP